jgi:transposase, IS5 family
MVRKISDPQLLLKLSHVTHRYAKEYQQIDRVLRENPAWLKLIHADLCASAEQAETGRVGMSADQVLRCLVVKQLKSYSYEGLAFAIGDSYTFRYFCGYDLYTETPCKSALQENISSIKAATLATINRQFLLFAKKNMLKTGKRSVLMRRQLKRLSTNPQTVINCLTV